MRALKWLLAILLIVVGAIFAVGFSLPDQVHVERSIQVQAPPAVVFATLNGYEQFQKWSPWADLDPNTRYTYEGPASGVGAKMSWHSDNANVGNGRQEIIESVANERIVSLLVFDGYDSDNRSSFLLQPDGEGTQLRWAYDTQFHGNLLGRYIGLKMDDWIGPDYEKGLARLKLLLEGAAAGASTPAAVDAGRAAQ